jgi:hypothetical protein
MDMQKSTGIPNLASATIYLVNRVKLGWDLIAVFRRLEQQRVWISVSHA